MKNIDQLPEGGEPSPGGSPESSPASSPASPAAPPASGEPEGAAPATPQKHAGGRPKGRMGRSVPGKPQKGRRGKVTPRAGWQARAEREKAIAEGEKLARGEPIAKETAPPPGAPETPPAEAELAFAGSTKDIWELVNRSCTAGMPTIWKDLEAPVPAIPGVRAKGTQLDALVQAWDKLLAKYMPWLLRFQVEIAFVAVNLIVLGPRAYAIGSAVVDHRKKRQRQDDSARGSGGEGSAAGAP